MMHSSRENKLFRFCIFILVLLLIYSESKASIAVTPKFIFIDQTKSSTIINLINNGTTEEEIWIDFVFGYISSDDSGRIKLIVDSTNTDEASIAQYLQAYPKRFILGPGEAQTVRIGFKSMPSILDGEYWSRILINSKPRNVLKAASEPSQLKTGLTFVTQQSLPFHYRKGNVNTGVTISDFNSAIVDTALQLSMKLTRNGNASFWGTRIIKIFNEDGKLISTIQKNLVVYKSLLVADNFSLKDIPPGRYTVQVECNTTRTDIKRTELVHALTTKASFSITR